MTIKPLGRAALQIAAAGATTLVALLATASAHAAYAPPSAQYGVSEVVNFPFTTSDGTTLTGSVYYPADLKTGARAPGRFPVLVDMTPYGMWDGNATFALDGLTKAPNGPFDGSDDAILRYFASHGYIGVELDARGTGRSGGTYNIWDPQQARDEVQLIDYVAHHLAGSNGVVGLTGMSYRGMNQWMVAGLLKRGTPVKAIAPASSGAYAFNRPFFMGGFPGDFWPAYQGLETVSEVPPADQVAAGGIDPVTLARVAANRASDAAYHAQALSNVASGGYMAHDDGWWQERDPIYDVRAIVRRGIPALITSGPNDFFASDSLQMYAALQDAAHRRSVWAPMDPRQSPDPRYQIVWSNSYSDGDYPYYLGYELQWYDHWLKHADNGVGSGEDTLRVQSTGGQNPWLVIPNGAYPMTRSYTPYYLTSQSTLTSGKPAAATGTLSWAPNQSLTFTSAPFAKGATLAGPVEATIYAASSSADVELVATLNDVAPDGTATTVTPAVEVDGALDGSERAVVVKRSWTDDAGRLILPFHPFTSASVSPVPAGKVERYDIEMLPRVWSLQPGHSLQLVIASQSPILQPTGPQLASLAGGSYTLSYGGPAASYLNLPLLAPDAFATTSDPATAGIGG